MFIELPKGTFHFGGFVSMSVKTIKWHWLFSRSLTLVLMLALSCLLLPVSGYSLDKQTATRQHITTPSGDEDPWGSDQRPAGIRQAFIFLNLEYGYNPLSLLLSLYTTEPSVSSGQINTQGNTYEENQRRIVDTSARAFPSR